MSLIDYSKMCVERVVIKDDTSNCGFRCVAAELIIKDQFGSCFKAIAVCTEKTGSPPSAYPLSFYIYSPLLCADKDFKAQNMAAKSYDEENIKLGLIANGFKFTPNFLGNWKPN